MNRHKLTAEEQIERASLNAALARYHTEPGWTLPVKGADGLWHLHPWTPAPRSPSGYAPPFREETPEPPPEPRPAPQGMSMADYQAMRSQSHAPPSPGSAAKAAQLHDEDKPKIDAKVKRAADKRKADAAKKAEVERLQQMQGSLL